MEFLTGAAIWLVELIQHWGYGGIFILTFLEATFVPIPSETTMIPAGYLVQQGKMSLPLVMVASVSGTIGGSLFMYWLAAWFGRPFLERYGRFIAFTDKRIAQLDRFFMRHGEIAICTGRLVIGIRHFIAFPAGLTRMSLLKFSLYTGIGGTLWMGALVAFGIWIGANQELVAQYFPYVVYGGVGLAVLMVFGYILYRKHAHT